MIIKPPYLKTIILNYSEFFLDSPDETEKLDTNLDTTFNDSTITSEHLETVSMHDNLPLYSEVDTMFETMNRTSTTKDFEELISTILPNTFIILCSSSTHNSFKYKRVSHIIENKYDDNMYFEFYNVCKETNIIINQRRMTSIYEYGISNFVHLYQILRGKVILNDGYTSDTEITKTFYVLKLINWIAIKDDISVISHQKMEEGGSIVIRIDMAEIEDNNFKLLLSILSKNFQDVLLVRSQITSTNDNHVFVVLRYFSSKEDRFGKTKNVNMKGMTTYVSNILLNYRENIQNWVNDVLKQNIKYQNIITDLTMKHNIISVISWCKNNNIPINNHYETKKKNKMITNIYKPTKYFDLKAFKKCEPSLLRLTNEALYSISKPSDANLIVETITDFLRKYKIKVSNCTITDATANIGGDTLSFALHFEKVNAVEIDSLNFEALQSNIRAFFVKNVSLVCDDYTKIYNSLKQDVVYIDAPWGGEYYEASKSLDLYLGKYSLSKLVKRIKCNYVFLKVPKNYNFTEFLGAFPWSNVELKQINSFVLICLCKR